jgi:hypothetical protein
MTWDFLHRWYMPFIWITLSSLFAVPLAVYFELGMAQHAGSELGLPYGSAWVARDDVLASLMPYLFGLVSIAWLFTSDGSTRWAAFWAGAVAVARIVAPMALVSMSGPSLANGQHYVDWNTMRFIVWTQDFQMFAFGIILWLAFGRFVGPNNNLVSHGAHAEAY